MARDGSEERRELALVRLGERLGQRVRLRGRGREHGRVLVDDRQELVLTDDLENKNKTKKTQKSTESSEKKSDGEFIWFF